MPATLEQLISVRSQLTEQAIHFFSAVADRLDQTPCVCQRDGGSEAIRASDVAVEPFVYTSRVRQRPSSADRGADANRDGLVDERSPMDEVEAARYELPLATDDREEVRWPQAVGTG